MDIHTDIVFRLAGYDVTSCFQPAVIAKIAENVVPDGFGSNIIGATFRQAQPIGGLLVNNFAYCSIIVIDAD